MKKLDNTQLDLLMTNLDEDGKLSCLKAFKVARLIGVKPKEMDAITKSLNIKITNCELGVFGKLKFVDMDDNIYNKLSENFNQGSKVECQVAWYTARDKGASLKKVGSTINNSDIKVTHCQLGCFYDEEFEKYDDA
ncbi:ModE family transcriptional regulator [Halarcobacter sp.]|uniref:ModE family transcriptional regulator n=1 Tax=Halarcobacter sp. TaxID=2321133 RepID=UPI0029F46456|nr:ModE family transcriptional regulator [Halarcobacter sp.]